MIANSARSGAVGTRPEGRDHQSGKDVRSGKESAAPADKEGVGVISPGVPVRVTVRRGRLEVTETSPGSAADGT
jgi:hypothetical protein